MSYKGWEFFLTQLTNFMPLYILTNTSVFNHHFYIADLCHYLSSFTYFFYFLISTISDQSGNQYIITISSVQGDLSSHLEQTH